MNNKLALPPGQKESSIFPRFGLPQYAERFPTVIDKVVLTIGGELQEFEISEELKLLPRNKQISNFHCVTTWSKLNLNWGGYSFRDFFETLILPQLNTEVSFVVLKAQDGYKTSLPLEDLLKDNVLLADELDAKPLSIEHGIPLRLIAPDHYGYKNVKHISRIEFYAQPQKIKKGLAHFMDHPTAKVASEERALTGPGILFRWLYKLGIKGTIKDFEKATAAYKSKL